MATSTPVHGPLVEMSADSHAFALSLEEQVARLQALLEASRQVHSSIEVSAVLQRTVNLLVRELELESAVVVDPLSGVMMAAFGTDEVPAAEMCQSWDLQARDGSVLAQLLVRPGERCTISVYERDFIEGLVLQAAVALENATFHERDVQWARVQQDLDAARGIQRSLLPTSMPAIPGLSLGARTVTCFEVGGDYLDQLRMPDGSHLVVVADVAGKGLASALLATSFRASFRAIASEPMPLEELVTRVGQHHWSEGSEARRRYVTAVFARFSTDGSELEIVNAGHNPAALLAPDNTVRMIGASGTPLGLLPGMQYTAERFAFTPGSRLLLYTDGLTEVFRGDDEFGTERLVDLFRDLETRSAEQSLEALWEGLEAFSPEAPQTDDRTAVVAIHQGGGTLAANGQDTGTEAGERA